MEIKLRKNRPKVSQIFQIEFNPNPISSKTIKQPFNKLNKSLGKYVSMNATSKGYTGYSLRKKQENNQRKGGLSNVTNKVMK